jgi:hypothetical protein
MAGKRLESTRRPARHQLLYRPTPGATLGSDSPTPSSTLPRTGVARDDILARWPACWTAERVLRGVAVRLPYRPLRDSRGLRMEIVR